MTFPEAFNSEDRLAAGHIREMAASRVNGLKALYALYQRPLMAFILKIVRQQQAAEEILQDVYVRAFEQADRYDPGRGTPFAWLATIARRKALDRIRHRDRRPQFVSMDREQPGDSQDNTKVVAPPNTHHDLEISFMRELLRDLPDAQQQAIELAFFRGFTHPEIAEALGRPLGTVKSDLRRGLMRLRKGYLGEDD